MVVVCNLKKSNKFNNFNNFNKLAKFEKIAETAIDSKDIVSNNNVESLEQAYLIMDSHGIEWSNETQSNPDFLNDRVYYYFDFENNEVAKYDQSSASLYMYDPPIKKLDKKTSAVYNAPKNPSLHWLIKVFAKVSASKNTIDIANVKNTAIAMYQHTNNRHWQKICAMACKSKEILDFTENL